MAMRIYTLPFFIWAALAFYAGVGCESEDRKNRPDNPKAALMALIEGNERFVSGQLRHPHQDRRRIHETEGGQHPFAAIVTCSDSRVPPEIIFDEGLGDLFVIRTAGNLVGDLELGSVEYAVEHLHVPLVVVLGHTECGAIKAFLEGGECHGHIRQIVEALKAEPEEQAVLQHEGKNLEACIEGNVVHGADQIRRQPIIARQIRQNKVEVVPMVYDVHTGAIKVLSEEGWRKHHAL